MGSGVRGQGLRAKGQGLRVKGQGPRVKGLRAGRFEAEKFRAAAGEPFSDHDPLRCELALVSELRNPEQGASNQG